MRDDRLLTPGQTCWRVERADQFACVIDAADYFKHVKAAMLRAQHRIMLIGWDFDARMTFERGVKTLPGPNQLGAFLHWTVAMRFGRWRRSTLRPLRQHAIYLENQYLAARRLVDALAARPREGDGPEIVIVLPRRGNSRLERETMDSARHLLIQVLWAADDHRRLGVYWPLTDGGAPIYVHSKVLVVDDRLMRVGSSNLNNRSMGFDSECDAAIEADSMGSEHDHVHRQITSVRDDLVSEHLGVSVGSSRQRC